MRPLRFLAALAAVTIAAGALTAPSIANGATTQPQSSVTNRAALGVGGAPLSVRANGTVRASLVKSPRAVIRSLSVSKHSLPAGGGKLALTIAVTSSKTCQLTIVGNPLSNVAIGTPRSSCNKGVFHSSIRVGRNPGTASETVVFKFVGRSATSQVTRRFSVRVAGARVVPPAPVTSNPVPGATPTASLVANANSFPATGGELALSYSAANATYCSISSQPAFWAGGNPTATGCSGTYDAAVPPTSSGGQWSFTFTAANAAGVSSSATQTIVEAAPVVTVTSTLPTLSLTSNAAAGVSSSLIVQYLGSLSATCTYSNGTSAPCAVPDGTLSFEVDGADVGGNVTYSSSDITGCTAAVGGDELGAYCNLEWATYGDEWITASYTTPGQSPISQTIEVDVEAPVDLAAGRTYSNYQNAGPGAIGDCTMAAVGDWIETTSGTAPSEASIVGAYWSAEDQYNAGADVGLTVSQLFSYWTSDGIAGSYLTADQSVTTDAAVEADLSDGTVLIDSLVLPPGFPPGTDGGGHMWIVVGYSSYGPMVVTWGQEVQIPWADFNAWTDGLYSVSASS